MDRKQKRRIAIFLLVPILAAILFITEDVVIRIITIALMVIYVAFIIFLRDSVKSEEGYEPSEDYDEQPSEEIEDQPSDFEESFEIVSKKSNLDVITSDNYSPISNVNKVRLKPPDLKEKFEEIANEELPEGVGHGGQFTFVLEKMLTVIKEAYTAHTAIFFWYNAKKEMLTIEKYVSGSEEVTKEKLSIQDDILSKIVQKGEPEILSEIPPTAETDVIRYYSSAQGIRSFIGVPLFYDNKLIAIIAIDAKVGDAFGVETIYALGRFVRVITMLIAIFEEKYSDTISQQRLNGLLKLLSPEHRLEDEKELILALQESVKFFLPWEAFTFVYFDPIQKRFTTKIVTNNTNRLKYIGQNLDIELKGTLVGKSILTGMPVKIDDMLSNEFKRFSKVEDINFEGSFLAVPLIYNNQNYGVLCFESLKKNAYSNADLKFLKNATNVIAFIIYSYSTQALLKTYLAIDIETGALNGNTFRERLRSDLTKAEMLKLPGAIALIKIDEFLEQESLFDGNPFPKVLESISETIANEMTPLNLFGRLDEKTFAVYFFNSNNKEVFLWAEKLRVKIARKPINVVAKQTTYTVSIGVASANNKLDVDEVIHNADLALKKAIERGGNAVRNIN